jgi:endogenous inhibitor of DNA gyrase (YacG/DUF329 family)
MNPMRLCPVCNRPIQEPAEADPLRPFCSKRCADIDLGRWLKGSYAIPAVETDDESESEASGSATEDATQKGPQGSRAGKPVRH